MPGDPRHDVARLLRHLLILVLGGKCEKCGGTLLEVLEIDHVDGCTWSRRAVPSHLRVERYWQEYREGVRLRVLCRRCNAQDGARRGNAWWYETTDVDQPAVEDEEVPF